ncbi:hypothetical protein Ssi03_37490 [Sphaerisporangium siamense]|uniref:Gram-positive cocci surface proteins LPxTG domain-containing protein n=1 Tax=Sphaerisporangium siamense TaxID=795645 RepID=A0A7W7GAP1_9ACTN|nr:hypothetical protein [Sphaerisporangium siamense]MBB4701634.1 hypothetical protein [Sphaerisporangium siamense]GII85759.1 hypothetical protein Ssi03_37490 [Sphaerisporangium siamense]
MGRRFTPVLLGIETAIALTFFATMTASATTGAGAFWHGPPSASPPTASSLGTGPAAPPEPAPAPRRTDSGSVGVTVRVLPPGEPPEKPGGAPATPREHDGRDAGVTVITGDQTTEFTENGTGSHDTGTSVDTTGKTGPGSSDGTPGKTGPNSSDGTARKTEPSSSDGTAGMTDPGSPGAGAPGGPAPARPGGLPFTGFDGRALALALTGAGACLFLGALLVRLTTRRRRKSL